MSTPPIPRTPPPGPGPVFGPHDPRPADEPVRRPPTGPVLAPGAPRPRVSVSIEEADDVLAGLDDADLRTAAAALRRRADVLDAATDPDPTGPRADPSRVYGLLRVARALEQELSQRQP